MRSVLKGLALLYLRVFCPQKCGHSSSYRWGGKTQLFVGFANGQVSASRKMSWVLQAPTRWLKLNSNLNNKQLSNCEYEKLLAECVSPVLFNDVRPKRKSPIRPPHHYDQHSNSWRQTKVKAAQNDSDVTRKQWSNNHQYQSKTAAVPVSYFPMEWCIFLCGNHLLYTTAVHSGTVRRYEMLSSSLL